MDTENTELRAVAAKLIAQKLREDPALLNAAREGYNTAKLYVSWATDKQVGDIWMMISSIVDAALVVADTDEVTAMNVIRSISSGGKFSAAFSYAKDAGEF